MSLPIQLLNNLPDTDLSDLLRDQGVPPGVIRKVLEARKTTDNFHSAADLERVLGLGRIRTSQVMEALTEYARARAEQDCGE